MSLCCLLCHVQNPPAHLPSRWNTLSSHSGPPSLPHILQICNSLGCLPRSKGGRRWWIKDWWRDNGGKDREGGTWHSAKPNTQHSMLLQTSLHCDIFVQTVPTGEPVAHTYLQPVCVRLPHDSFRCSGINIVLIGWKMQWGAAVSTCCSVTAKLCFHSLCRIRQLSEEQEETGWDIFTVAATHGGI